MTITITVEKDGYYEVNGTRQEPTVSLYVIPAASKLRRMLKDTKDLIVCPGVYDGLSARIAMQVGFKGLYMVRTLTCYTTSLYAYQVHRLVLELPHHA
jgi:methylisocitrate lyase